MKALHLLKTSEGGNFAARQAARLVANGVEIHAVLPSRDGAAVQLWESTGAVLHFANLDFPVQEPWRISERLRTMRDLVERIRPDVIHSHFFGTTLIMRYALGKTHLTPRFFQVPGPLHLENRVFRAWELSSSGPSDSWIASSDYIKSLYLQAGISAERVSRSYYGLAIDLNIQRTSFRLHDHLGLAHSTKLIGNVSYMYAPKLYLGQTVGLKCHEDLIDAMAAVNAVREDTYGVLIGGPWGRRAHGYEQRLRDRAFKKGHGRILLLGVLSREMIDSVWTDFTLVAHVPLSENCGGVVEPLLSAVPVIASRVGGLPEIVEDGVTGDLVPVRSPLTLSEKILKVLENPLAAKERAQKGQARVRKLFDINQTSAQIDSLYEAALKRY